MAKIIGNTTATPNPRPDWLQNDETKADYIKNKPDIATLDGAVKLNDIEGNVSNGVNTLASGNRTFAGTPVTMQNNLSDVQVRVLWNPASEAITELEDGVEYTTYTDGVMVLESGLDDAAYVTRFRMSVLRNSNGTSAFEPTSDAERVKLNDATQITLKGTPELIIVDGEEKLAITGRIVSLATSAWSQLTDITTVTYNDETWNSILLQLSVNKHPDEATLYYITNANLVPNDDIVSATSFGSGSIAGATAACAKGNDTLALAPYSSAEGSITLVHPAATFGHAEGVRTRVFGVTGHAEGGETMASGERSHAEGSMSGSYGFASHAEGNNTTANGLGSHSEGRLTQARDIASHAEGDSTKALAADAHAEGFTTEAKFRAHSEGDTTKAYGWASHTEGRNTSTADSANWTTGGVAAHAEGVETQANNVAAHSEGYKTTAGGKYSHAGGENTQAKHQGSFTHGLQLSTGRNYQTIVGQYGVEDSNAFFVVATGSGEDTRKNQFTVTGSGVNTAGAVNLSGVVSLNESWVNFNKGASFKAKAFLDAGATASELNITSGPWLTKGLMVSTIGADGANNAGGVRTNTLYLRNSSNQDETLTYNDIKNLKEVASLHNKYRLVSKKIVLDTKTFVENKTPFISVSTGEPRQLELDNHLGLIKFSTTVRTYGYPLDSGVFGDDLFIPQSPGVYSSRDILVVDIVYKVDTPENDAENPFCQSDIYYATTGYELLDENWNLDGTNNVLMYYVEEV